MPRLPVSEEHKKEVKKLQNQRFYQKHRAERLKAYTEQAIIRLNEKLKTLSTSLNPPAPETPGV
jgi:hypothetical protein